MAVASCDAEGPKCAGGDSITASVGLLACKDAVFSASGLALVVPVGCGPLIVLEGLDSGVAGTSSGGPDEDPVGDADVGSCWFARSDDVGVTDGERAETEVALG